MYLARRPFNRFVKQITVRVSATKLNAYLTSIGHTPVGIGTVMCGLRGHAYITDPAGENLTLQDITRGGTEFSVGNAP